MKKKDKILGCLFGGAIGDAIGSKHENSNNKTIDKLTVGQITDDTQLTMATCQSFNNNLIFDPESIANHFLKWYKKKVLRGLGSSTLKALKDLEAGQHWALSGATGERSAGNGAAMRIAPLAFYFNASNFKDRTPIKDITSITHRNEEAYIASLAIIHSIQNSNSNSQLFYTNLIETLPDSNTRDNLIEYHKLNFSLPILDSAKKFGVTGYAPESIPFSIYCALHPDNISFEDMLIKIIEAGGDTDTNCSLAGQIFGSKHGLNSLPNHWVAEISKNKALFDSFNEFASLIEKEKHK